MYPTVPSTLPGCVAAASYEPVSSPACGIQRRRLGEAEVEDLDDAVPGDHQVLGLQVPVHDPARVGGGQALGDLGGDLERLLERRRSAVEQLAHGLSVDELHRDVGDAVGRADVVDRDDVGMVQGRGGAGLGLEAGQEARRRSAIAAGRTLIASSRWSRESRAR